MEREHGAPTVGGSPRNWNAYAKERFQALSQGKHHQGANHHQNNSSFGASTAAMSNVSFATDASEAETDLLQELNRVPDMKDEGSQAEFTGATRDACEATVVTTADIESIIPLPDSSVLLHSTLDSLRNAEKEASELLRHIQRDLLLQLQEAGIGYQTTTLDKLHDASRFNVRDTSLRAAFTPRKQLTFQSSRRLRQAEEERQQQWADLSDPANQYTPQHVATSLPRGAPASPSFLSPKDASSPQHATSFHEAYLLSPSSKELARERKEYWKYTAQKDDCSLYPEGFVARARVMNQLRESAKKRHSAFESMNNELAEQARLRASLYRVDKGSASSTGLGAMRKGR